MPLDSRCPLCGSEMVIRTAKKGPEAGHRFNVCIRYPDCKGKVPIRKQMVAEGPLETMSVSKVSSLDELFPALYQIGTNKNFLPNKLKGWVNVLGLYVQTGLIRRREYLAAGGKYKKCFYAICEYNLNGDWDIDMMADIMASTSTGDFRHWNVEKFDKKV